MGTGSVAGTGALQATLSAEGRSCSARAMRGTAVGSACGPAVVAEHADSLRDAAAWMPGRILVLCGDALSPQVLTSVLTGPPSFAAVVALTGDPETLGTPADEDGDMPTAAIPLVAVVREQDQLWVRRAVRLFVEVQVGTQLRLERSGPQIVLPRPRRPRRSGVPTLGVPGVPGAVRS